MPIAYEKDFYGWCLEQEDAMKRHDTCALDWENLIEEIASLGRSEKRALISHFDVLFTHLLKWIYQPEYKGKSWRDTIDEQRIQIKRLLSDNPSLESKKLSCADEAYEDARRHAAKETRLPINTFPAPEDREFTIEWALNGEIE